MIKQKYSAQIYAILAKYIKPTPQIFIFGSALRSKTFSDVDVGILGVSVSESALYRAKEALEESSVPYKIDLVNFKNVDASFKEEVFSKKIQWLT